MTTNEIIKSLKEKAAKDLKAIDKAKRAYEAALASLIVAERENARTVAYLDQHLQGFREAGENR